MNKKTLILIGIISSLALTTPAFCEIDQETLEKATTYYNDAIDLYKQDNVDKSINYFQKALDLNPEFYEAHYNLSQILMSVNRNDEAIKSLEEIAKLKPNDSENLYNLGKVYYKKGYLQKSYENLKKIAVNDAQYDSAKLLISKIEARQNELNLEEKINQHHIVVDIQGKAQSVELGEFQAPSGVVADDSGNIYLASFLENRIYKISSFGQKSLLTRTNLILLFWSKRVPPEIIL